MDRFKGLHLLVADDNRLNNQALKQLLEFSGASVSTAENGREALKWLRTSAKPFHLILMDINMPELDGLETTRIIRQDKEIASIPIIAITADCSPQDQWLCFQAGMDEHIAKPLDFEKLCTIIASVLDQKHNQLDSLAESLDDSGEFESKQEIFRRFANNSDLVVQMISLYQQEFQELLQELDRGPCKPSETLHSLSGLASTIGVNEVERRVLILSELIKSNMANNSALEEAKTRLIQAQLGCSNQLTSMFGICKTTDHRQQQLSDSLCLTSKQKQNLINLLQMSDLTVISEIENIKHNHPKNSFVLKLSEYVNQLKFREVISLISANNVSNNKFSRPKNAE